METAKQVLRNLACCSRTNIACWGFKHFFTNGSIVESPEIGIYLGKLYSTIPGSTTCDYETDCEDYFSNPEK